MRHLTFEHNSPRIAAAIKFAAKAHEGQRRKYTGEPYVAHPIAVGRILFHHGATEDQVIAGILHDTIEDCGVTREGILALFGRHVADMVVWLSDASVPEDGNRATRKEIDRQHIAKAPADVKTVKCVDLFHNTMSIAQHDVNFAKTYLEEKGRILEVIEDADHVGLFQMTYDMWVQAKNMLDARRLQEDLLIKEMNNG